MLSKSKIFWEQKIYFEIKKTEMNFDSDVSRVLTVLSLSLGGSVAQWVKRWPTDQALPSSSPVRVENFLNCKQGSIAHSLRLSSAYRPDMTEILL